RRPRRRPRPRRTGSPRLRGRRAAVGPRPRRRRPRRRIPRPRRRSRRPRGRSRAMRLDRALAAECRKVFSTRIWWILAAVLFGYVAINTVAIAFAFTLDAGGAGMPPFPPEALTSLVYSIATATGYVFPVIFGAMLV